MLKRTPVSVAISAAFAAGVTGFVPTAVAQTQSLDRVEITGSLLRRTDAETALPVTVIRAEDLVRTGVTTAEQAVARIAANQTALGVSQSVGATTGGKASADLRGIGEARTLILLNGRRLSNSAIAGVEGSVDLNAIPLNSIDRIEVLRDGASAIYGTDAIGGVINFIQRRDFTGIELAAEYQQPEDDGGRERRFTALAGFGSLDKDRFNIMGSLDYRKQKVMLATDRSFSRTGILGPTRDDILSGTSGSSFPGDVDGFEPSGPGCAPPQSVPLRTADGSAFESCRYDFTQDIDIIPENEQITGLLRGTLRLGQDHQVTAEYLRSQNKVLARIAPVPTAHLIDSASPFYPPGAAAVDDDPDFNVVNWRTVPAGKRAGESEATTDRWVLDFQGAVAGFEYRAGFGRSTNKTDDSVIGGYTNDDLLQEGILAGVINPFGAQTAAGQAAIGAALVNEQTIRSKGEVDFIDGRVTKDLLMLPAGPLAMAFGAEFRKEEYTFVAEEITRVVPSIGVDPDSDVTGKRDVTALFTELAIPILKNLDATVAVRYDDYDDVGSTFNPKIALRYQPVPQVLLRGSYNTGFRAPTLYEIYQPASLTFTSDNYDDPLLCPGGTPVPGASSGVVCGQQTLARQFGPASIGRPLDALQPEESQSFNFGIVLEPIPEVTFGLDFWWIDIEKQISVLPEQAIFADPVKYASRFTRCSQISAAERADIDSCLNFPSFDPIAYIDQPNENLGDLKTNGFDVNLQVRLPATAYGRFGVTLDGTYVSKYEFQREQGGEFIQNVGRYADAFPIFRWQHVLAFNYSAGPWSATFLNRYKSGYTDQDPVNEVDSYSTFDLFGTWTGIRGLGITAGIKNLFDEDPPFSNQNTTFQRGYDPRFTDPRGRTYVVRASYKFF